MNFEEWCRENKPSILEEYYPESNLGIPLSSFSLGDHRTAIWRCKRGHGWFAVVYSRKKVGCPVCSNRLVIPGINDLKFLDPELASQYSTVNKIPVDRIGPFSHKHVIWDFPCGHSYSVEVKLRHMYRTGCKYCEGGAVLSGINDLKTLCPLIVKDWDYSNNDVGPDQVRPSSNIERNWICQYCGRPYRMPPYTR